MGNVVKNKIKGMNLWAKVGLVVTLTVLMSTFMYQGWYKPKGAEAVIATTTAWTILPSTYHTATKTPTANIAVAGTASTNRVLAVAVTYIGTAAGTATCGISYGGTALTLAAGDAAATSSLEHSWIFYLPENNTLMDGTSRALTTTITSTTTGFLTDAYYTVLSGVDQTTPLGSGLRPNVSKTTVAATAVAFTTGSGLIVNANEQAIAVIGSARLASTTAVTVTTPTGWTLGTGQNSTTTNSNRSYVHTKAIPATNQTEDLMAATASSANCTTSVTAVSFRPSVSAITTTLATGIMSTTSNATVSQSDTNKPVGSFTLSASGGADTVTGLVINGGTNLTTANVSSVKIWADTNGNGVLDAGEITSPVATQATIATNTATFTGLSLTIASGTTNSYIITYDIGTAPTNTNTLTAYVSSFTPGGNIAGTDAVDSTLTISNTKTNAGTATALAYGPTFIAVSMPYTNDLNTDNTYTVDYAPYTSGLCSAIVGWTNSVTNAAHSVSPANTAINGLTPSTQYCVKATYNDATGVIGTSPQYIGPVTTRAAGTWSVLNDSNPAATTLTGGAGGNGRTAFPYTAAAGSNRLVLVAVEITNGSSITAAANSYVVTLGGVALTKISGTDDGVATNRAGLYLGYVKESSIPAGPNHVDFGTTATSNFTSYKVMASTYSGIDQNSPLSGTASLSYSSTAATTSTGISIPGTGTYSAGDQPILVMGSSVAQATLTSYASTPTGVYTELTNGILGSANAGMLAVSNRTIPVASGQDTGVTVTWPSSARPAVIGAALRAYVVNTTAGTATAVIDGHQGINVTAPYSGDGNGDNTVKVEWQVAGGNWNSPIGSYGPAHINSYNIPSLTVGGVYDVRVTYADNDGLSGTAAQTITSVTVTEISTIVLTGSVTTPTPFTIAFNMPYNYDTNINNTYTVDYKVSGAGSWTNFITGAAHTTSPYQATITGLLPDTNYDVQLTFIDVNGITGTNPQLFTTVHTPAENRTTAGAASASIDTTSSISFSMPYTYDMDGSNTYTVDYSVTGSNTWVNVVTAAGHATSPYAGSISALTPGTSYDIRMTYNDDTGVLGTNPQTITVVLPVDSTTAGAMTFIPSDVQMVIKVSYTNDQNANNTVAITYGTDGTSYGSAVPAPTVDRANSEWTSTVTGLTANAKYYFKATFIDVDGIIGTNPVSASQKTATAWANNKMLHNSTNMGSTKWPKTTTGLANDGWGIPGGKYDAFVCTTCHNPTSTNIKRVSTSISATGTARNVVYRNVTSAGHDARTNNTTSFNVCETCHSQNKYHNYNAANNTGGNTHNNGSVCNGCHPHSTGFAVDMTNCIGCHNAAIVSSVWGGAITRRNIVGEFAMTFSHKRAATGAVTSADCKVCHMEGEGSYHGDGYIDLRNPDTGLAIEGVTFGGTGAGNYTSTGVAMRIKQFSRNLASSTIEAETAAMMINHCLKCHDADGALSPKSQIAGNPLKPFGTSVASTATYFSNKVAAGNTAGSVVDVNSSFDTTNASYHPVRGKQNNSYITTTSMKAPWNTVAKTAGNTTSYGMLITCWDCHAPAAATGLQTASVTAHGAGATLRFDSWLGATSPALNLCTVCHADGYALSTSNHSTVTGSAFATGGASNIGAARFRICTNCHSSGSNSRPWRGVDAHGFNQMAELRGDVTTAANALKWGGTARGGSRPYAFFRTAALGSWRPATGTGDTLLGTVGCSLQSGGSPSCSNSHGTFGPGGTY